MRLDLRLWESKLSGPDQEELSHRLGCIGSEQVLRERAGEGPSGDCLALRTATSTVECLLCLSTEEPERIYIVCAPPVYKVNMFAGEYTGLVLIDKGIAKLIKSCAA